MKTDKTVTIKLEYPVQGAEGLISQVVIRRPTMQEEWDYPLNRDSSVKEEMPLMARLVGLDVEDLLLFDCEDYQRLQDQYVTFRKPTEPGGDAKTRRAARKADKVE